MPGKNKTLYIPVLMAVVLGLAAGLYLLFKQDDAVRTDEPAPFSRADGPIPNPGAAGKMNQVEAYLYFASSDGSYLSSERRHILHPGDSAGFGERIVQELLKGPQGNLNRTIPDQASLLAFYISDDGIAYVDFSPEIKELYPGGSHSEYLTIYSIVNTIVYNVPDIKAVKILVSGNESTTLAGHIGIGSPIKADMVMVR